MGCLGLWELGKSKRWNATFPATYLPVSVLCLVYRCVKKDDLPRRVGLWELRQKVGELYFEFTDSDLGAEFLLQLYAGAEVLECSGEGTDTAGEVESGVACVINKFCCDVGRGDDGTCDSLDSAETFLHGDASYS